MPFSAGSLGFFEAYVAVAAILLPTMVYLPILGTSCWLLWHFSFTARSSWGVFVAPCHIIPGTPVLHFLVLVLHCQQHACCMASADQI